MKGGISRTGESINMYKEIFKTGERKIFKEITLEQEDVLMCK
jgi:hypothetical protein